MRRVGSGARPRAHTLLRSVFAVSTLCGGLGVTVFAHADVAALPPAKPRAILNLPLSDANGWDYALGGASATAAIVELAVFQNMNPPLRWTDPILFDTDVRSLLRSSSPETRAAFNDTASVLWALQLSYPLLVDVPFAWTHFDRQVAWDLFWQDAVTEILTGALDAALRDVAGRARPYVYECLQSGAAHCLDSPEATRSFPGGHFMNSTADSVLTCTQHLYLRLYGGAWDGLTCALTLASDLTVGVLRIVSDDHWASDEIVGGALGALVGWGVPYFMHLRGRGGDRARAAMVAPMPMRFDQGGGVGVIGIF